MFGCSRNPRRLGIERGRGRNDDTTTSVRCMVDGFGGGGYKESRPWCSLFVGLPSLFVAPSGERLALPMCWEGDKSLSTISRVFVPMFFYGQSIVSVLIVHVEGVAFWPREELWLDARAFLAKNMFTNSIPKISIE